MIAEVRQKHGGVLEVRTEQGLLGKTEGDNTIWSFNMLTEEGVISRQVARMDGVKRWSFSSRMSTSHKRESSFRSRVYSSRRKRTTSRSRSSVRRLWVRKGRENDMGKEGWVDVSCRTQQIRAEQSSTMRFIFFFLASSSRQTVTISSTCAQSLEMETIG